MADVVPLDALVVLPEELETPDPQPTPEIEFTIHPAELVSVDAGGEVTLADQFGGVIKGEPRGILHGNASVQDQLPQHHHRIRVTVVEVVEVVGHGDVTRHSLSVGACFAQRRNRNRPFSCEGRRFARSSGDPINREAPAGGGVTQASRASR